MNEKLKLMDLVRHVADELRESHFTRDLTKPTVMTFVEFEITASFEVEVDVGGKVNLWAVELGASGTRSTTNTVKLKYVVTEKDLSISCEADNINDVL